MNKKIFRRVFGARVRALRQVSGFSQDVLAAELGHVNRGYISHIECGRKNVSLYTAVRLARALEVELVDLL